MKDRDCVLCIALDSEVQLDYYAGFAIIQTKNKKGHSQRIMVMTRWHEREVEQVEKDIAMAFLFRYIISHRRDDDWTIMEPTHASIPAHWHLVGSTIDEGEDQKLIADTGRIEIRFLKAGERA
jgi:hypothetical protein